ncbi:glycoside hydrolase family 3 N-terminal domain-containing protein [Pseudonocardia humida]|uniref:Fibronectin type III-like domain-contianing protein n=1 Tax=Pseudonocardia humida TaxID=2800819 RepID=A0ABT0ZSB0_9PSEU|nr:glycoside hydrolase family 3 N-terminal domain-containing protein [Pseudonocardia humida]MCO1653597.1 fibronectin type III-like domain-contianing protein [Pseudonocardia humida]
MSPAPSPRRGPVVAVPGPDERPEPFITALLEHMTLGEKIGQLVGTLLPAADTELAPGLLDMPPGVLAVPAMTAAESNRAVRRLQLELTTRTRMRIPALPVALAEPRGATRFPPPMARAAGWDRELVGAIAAAAAAQLRAGGVVGQLAPAVALAVGPDTARMSGCFGGSAVLAAELVAAHVRGAQGPDPDLIDAEHVAAAATGFGGVGRSPDTAVMTDLDRRTLRAEVLVPAEAAVRAGVAMVVPTHGGNDGLPAHVDDALLRTLLRDEWEFAGPVLAAPGAVAALVHRHRVAEDLDAARAMVWESGVDASLIATHPDVRGERITGMVRRGSLPEWLVDEAVAALLRLKWRLGLWARPLPPDPDERPARVAAAAELADRAAVESMVLLADPTGVLPLRGSGGVRLWAPPDLPGAALLARRLAAALPGAAVALDIADDPPEGAETLVALLPEHRPTARLRAVAEAATGRPVVAVLTGGSTGGVAELLERPTALLLCWEGVAEWAGTLAAVLSGAAEPGGRMPVGPGAGGHLPLGHGSGYTGFAYSDLELPARLPAGGAPLRVGCLLTNTGRRDGKEVVQVYLRHRIASVTTPERGLGGFTAVRVPAGAAVRVEVSVPVERFAVWGRGMRRAVEPGEFEVLVGRSATDIRLSGRTTAVLPEPPTAGHSRSEQSVTPFG